VDVDFDEIQPRVGTQSIKWDYASVDGVLELRRHDPDEAVEHALLPMWVADMDFRPAEPILQALTGRLEGVLGYTRLGIEHYEAISSWVKERHGWNVSTDWIMPTIGTLPIVNLAIQVFTKPGDAVIVQPPVFYPIPKAAENNGRVVLENPLRLEDGRYHIDFVDLAEKAADPRCKMLLLCSPHNPVGRVWSPDELRRLGEICVEHDLLLLSDELHSDLSYSWADFVSIGAVDEQLHERIIVCSGPSKAFNMPGLKAAYAIVPNAGIRAELTQGLQNLDLLFSVDAVSTLALRTAYQEGGDWLRQLLDYLEGNLAFLNEFLLEELPMISIVQPDATFLVWLDCRQLDLQPEELRRLFVDEARVYAEIGNSYGAQGEGFVRLNIGCSRQLLASALTRLHQAVRRELP
jgi:cystathionine beta-lyase